MEVKRNGIERFRFAHAVAEAEACEERREGLKEDRMIGFSWPVGLPGKSAEGEVSCKEGGHEKSDCSLYSSIEEADGRPHIETEQEEGGGGSERL